MTPWRPGGAIGSAAEWRAFVPACVQKNTCSVRQSCSNRIVTAAAPPTPAGGCCSSSSSASSSSSSASATSSSTTPAPTAAAAAASLRAVLLHSKHSSPRRLPHLPRALLAWRQRAGPAKATAVLHSEFTETAAVKASHRRFSRHPPWHHAAVGIRRLAAKLQYDVQQRGHGGAVLSALSYGPALRAATPCSTVCSSCSCTRYLPGCSCRADSGCNVRPCSTALSCAPSSACCNAFDCLQLHPVSFLAAAAGPSRASPAVPRRSGESGRRGGSPVGCSPTTAGRPAGKSQAGAARGTAFGLCFHCQCDTAFGMCVQCSDRMRGHAKTVNPASTRQ